MGKRIELTYKQGGQILSFFENSHISIVDPNNIDNSGIIALFRACRDYCNKIAGNYSFDRKISDDDREKYRLELIERLKLLSIRYYMRL